MGKMSKLQKFGLNIWGSNICIPEFDPKFRLTSATSSAQKLAPEREAGLVRR